MEEELNSTTVTNIVTWFGSLCQSKCYPPHTHKRAHIYTKTHECFTEIFWHFSIRKLQILNGCKQSNSVATADNDFYCSYSLPSSRFSPSLFWWRAKKILKHFSACSKIIGLSTGHSFIKQICTSVYYPPAAHNTARCKTDQMLVIWPLYSDRWSLSPLRKIQCGSRFPEENMRVADWAHHMPDFMVS